MRHIVQETVTRIFLAMETFYFIGIHKYLANLAYFYTIVSEIKLILYLFNIILLINHTFMPTAQLKEK